MTAPAQARGQQGFTLLEVMIAVLVVAVGLLGLAKMQALAFASTQVSSVRSLISFQTSSLAASMHGNRAYWAAGTAISFTTTGTTITDASNVLNATLSTGKCTSVTCSAAELAAYDVQQWLSKLVNQFPTATTSVSCSGSPVTCTVSVSWTEKTVTAMNAATAASASATWASNTYTLQVLP